ncbi:MAG: nucleotidyltransferase domain-containing protein [Nitrospinae bacterium]|nr:nucleotidyltransferase domain-containing protein [Nitrospinota bacterium]
MEIQETIHLAVRRIVDASHPQKVILFGSQVYGSPKPDSDVDFLVIEREVSSKAKEMARLRDAVGAIGTPIDIMVYSERDVLEWGGLPGTALYWALKEGKVLYEASH